MCGYINVSSKPIDTSHNIHQLMTLIKRIVTVFSLALSLNAIGQKNCDYKIDTSKILANENLDNFLFKIQRDTFKVSYDKKDIPSFIKRQLNCLTHGFSIANPNQEYQATDVLYRRLPSRQLIFLATSKDMVVMTYLMGGIAESTHVLFIKSRDKKIVDLWTGLCIRDLKSTSEIFEYISEKQNKKPLSKGRKIYF